MVRFLLNHGFEVNFAWSETAVFNATPSKHSDIVRLLTEHGANLDAKSDLRVAPRRLLRDQSEELLSLNRKRSASDLPDCVCPRAATRSRFAHWEIEEEEESVMSHSSMWTRRRCWFKVN